MEWVISDPRESSIPWLDRDRLALVKIRQPEGKRAEVRRSVPRPPERSIQAPRRSGPGMPLVIVEGEFDALLLGQELGDWPPS